MFSSALLEFLITFFMEDAEIFFFAAKPTSSKPAAIAPLATRGSIESVFLDNFLFVLFEIGDVT